MLSWNEKKWNFIFTCRGALADGIQGAGPKTGPPRCDDDMMDDRAVELPPREVVIPLRAVRLPPWRIEL